MEQRPANLLFVQAFEGAQAPTEAAPLTVPRVKILGLESRWGRRFTEAALKDAQQRGIYEGLTIYKDHPSVDYSDPNWQKKTLPPRSVDDVLGSIANVIYIEGQGLFGDAVFTKDCDLTRSVCLSAKTNPRQYGFSHHAAYDNVSYEGNIEIVGSIPAAFSVDLVTRPATTNGLFEGDSIVKDKAKGTQLGTQTVRQALEAICALPIAKRVVQALEGDYMDAAMPSAAEGASVDDQIASAFRTAGMAIFDDTGMDDKSKLGKLKDLFAAKSKLTGTGDTPAPGDGKAATEGASPPGKDPVVDEEDKGKPGTESAPPQPIGTTEALNLLEKHKLPITRVALESYAMLPAPVAESHAAREAATHKELTTLKDKLALVTNEKPRSIPRIGMEGGAAPKVDKAQQEELDKKPWLSFSRN